MSDIDDLAWEAVRRLRDKLLGKNREPTDDELREMVEWALESQDSKRDPR